MWPFRSPKQKNNAATIALYALLGAITLAKVWFIVGTPLRALVMSPWLLDDSFITMEVARNVAEFGRFSFDGLHLTTGVAPLWTYLIAIPLIGDDKSVTVPVVLLLSTLCGTLCSWVVYRIAANLTDDRWTAVAAAVLTALMPAQFFNAMNGMETAFFSLLILLALGGAAHALRFSPVAWRHGAWTGAFLGVAILTRADSLFAIAAIGMWKAWMWYAEPKKRAETTRETIAIGVMVLAALALFLAWQTIQTGSPFPDNQVGRRAIALEDHGFDPAHFALMPYLKISTWNVFQLESLWSLATGSTLLALLALAWACMKKETAPMARVGTLYIALFAAVLCFYQWYFPDLHGLRYINAGSHVAILFLTLFIAQVFAGTFRHLALAACCIVLLTLSWYRYADTMRHYASFKDMGLFGQSNVETQDKFWSAIDWVKENVPEDATIALRDHGRMAFFTDRRIQDLAGILDGEVLSHKDNGTLGAYLAERGVTYSFLPDPSPGGTTIYQQMHESLRLQRVLGAPNQEITGYKPYKVLGARP